MTNYFIIPGLGNSGDAHWQTYFERSIENCNRIHQREWNTPDCGEWISTIDDAIKDYEPATVVLIAHSLGCTAVAHWAKKYKRIIKGALLVAPSDIESPVYSFEATGFTPIPLETIHFKTIVVASSNDVWVKEERAKFFSDSWNSTFISIGAAGHINADAGYGEWKQGLEILKMI